jgi:hypothetical protein
MGYRLATLLPETAHELAVEVALPAPDTLV